MLGCAGFISPELQSKTRQLGVLLMSPQELAVAVKVSL